MKNYSTESDLLFAIDPAKINCPIHVALCVLQDSDVLQTANKHLSKQF